MRDRLHLVTALLIGLLLGGAGGFSQTFAQASDGPVVLSGRVVDAESGEPLTGAEVTVRVDGRVVMGTTTGADGRFELSIRRSGSGVLVAGYIGYASRERTVELSREASDPLILRLRSAPIGLGELTVTGDRPAGVPSYPGASVAIDPRDVELMDPVGTQEMLSSLPGLYGVVDDGMGRTRVSVGIRGLKPRRTSRVLVLEDGMPIQPAPYVFPPLYYNPPAERVERVEVIKSSGAVRHGPQTMGGVINYVTARPDRDPSGSVRVTGGSDRYAGVFAEAGGWGTDRLRPQVQFIAKRGDGYRQNNDFRQLNGTTKLQWLPDSSRSVYLKTNFNYEHTNATYTGLTPYSFERSPSFNPKEHDLYEVYRASVGLIYNRTISDRLRQTSRLYANVFDRDWWREFDVYVRASDYEPGMSAEEIDPVPWYTSGPLVRIGGGERSYGNLRRFHVGGLEQSYRLDHRLPGGLATLEVGGRVHWEQFRDYRKLGDEPDARTGIFYRGDPDEPETLEIVGQAHHYETRALALYALEDWQIGALRVRPGLRFEVFEQQRVNRLLDSRLRDETSAVLLPGLGLNYAIDGVNLFASFHRGYTPPSSATLKIVNFAATPDPSEEGLDLRSEKSWNSELGVRTRSRWGSLEAAGFHLYVRDLVGGRTVFQNLGRVASYGLEMKGRLRASNVSSFLPDLDASYTFLRTRVVEGEIPSALKAGGVTVDVSGNELPYAPTHTLTGAAVFQPTSGLRARFSVRYVGRVYTDLENIEETSPRGDMGQVPGHTVADASLRYSFGPGLGVQITGKNVFDNAYVGSRLHSNPRQPQAHLSSGILPGPPRRVSASLTYSF